MQINLLIWKILAKNKQLVKEKKPRFGKFRLAGEF
jgi:hypothetical protein